MPETTYTYDVAADFPTGKVNTADLQAEIVADAAILIAPARIDGAGGTFSGGVQTGGTVDIVMKDGLSAPEATALDALVVVHQGEPTAQPAQVVQLESTQADDTPLVAIKGRFGREVIYATHNLCDETTWYSESARAAQQALTDSGDGLTFASPHPCWIDMIHGKVFDEEGLIEDQQILNPGDPHGYGVSVEVEESPGVWVEKASRAPFAAAGGDYTIDYTAGAVTFASAPVGAVRASYSHKAGSGWRLPPLPGKALLIEKAEIQFSVDIGMNATFVMQAFGHVLYFAPHLAQSNGGPLPDDTPVPIDTTNYKTIDQIIDEAIMAFPPIPALGGSRGYAQPKHVFQFHYAALRTLWSSLGMFLRIHIEGDGAFDGERATATFYCTSKPDPGPSGALALLTAE